MATRQAPVTPGEILLEDFLKPLGLSQDRLAKEVGVPSTWISEIVAGRRSITAETDSALRALQVTLSASEG
ncbi:MAG: addiction module antidote protein, HigA family [Trueperaceae bacterium]|nr:MAG: addiction module antidote protein, HigA family [Trueperaceae bacterium]